ncbi:MAG: 30S ribosomal protein S20 [Ghiorsea sp.]
MANHVSAEKRARQDIKKRDNNRNHTSAMRTTIKRVHEAIAAGDKELANSSLVQATSKLARAGQKGQMHANQASRRISRLNANVKAMNA